MKNQLLLSLQKKYQTSGYALVAPRSGKVYAFEKDIKKLYNTIHKEKIEDKNKMVVYVPSPHAIHIF